MAIVRVGDVMTVTVATVDPQTPLKAVAEILVRLRVSGVPVLDHGRVVGIVSESDLLPLKEGGPGRPLRVAADVMTAPVVTLMEEASVPEAARVLHRHGIKRAPVVRDGRLVGIVTKSDLLRPYLRTDSEIRAQVELEILGNGLGFRRRDVDVAVDGGVVRLEGHVGTDRDRSLMVRLVRSVDGVVDVEDALAVEATVAVG